MMTSIMPNNIIIMSIIVIITLTKAIYYCLHIYETVKLSYNARYWIVILNL